MTSPASAPNAVSYEDYQVAVERSVDGVMITAPDGRILYANDAACTMLRASEEEIIRTGRQGFSPPGDPRWAEAVEERARTGRTHFIAPMLRGDGSRFEAEVTSSVFKGIGGELRTIVIIRDVTARIRLERRQDALNEIISALLGGVATGDVLTLVSRHARELLEASDAGIFTPTQPPGYIRVVGADGPAMTQLLGRVYPPESLAARVVAEGRPLLIPDLTAAATTEDGRRVGLGPGIVVPIVADGQVFGDLMVGAPPGSRPYETADLEEAKVFAARAAVALALGEARAEVEAFHRRSSEQLKKALDTRVVIEQAKGFIAATRGVGTDEAFDRLRKYARSHSTNVHDVAARVVARQLML